MSDTRTEVIERLLDSYRTYYNVSLYDEDQLPLRALCEYYEQAERYVLFRRANLWTTQSEEFIYLYEMPVLTLDLFEQCLAEAQAAGMELAHIGPGHMYTYITPIFVCDSSEPAALKALKKTSIHKTFRFSFHGWMDVNLAVYEADSKTITSNRAGKSVKKVLEKVLFKKGVNS